MYGFKNPVQDGHFRRPRDARKGVDDSRCPAPPAQVRQPNTSSIIEKSSLKSSRPESCRMWVTSESMTFVPLWGGVVSAPRNSANGHIDPSGRLISKAPSL